MERAAADVGTGGWMFLAEEAVPERWRARARQVWFVPLLPEEALQLLSGEGATAEIDPQDEEIARLLAAGSSAEAIAARLMVSTRSVHRRLQQLRERFGVGSNGELTLFLARRGF